MNQVTDLNGIGVAAQISEAIANDVDAFCSKFYDDGHRSHLGASLIGDECKRKLWYGFRWVYHKIHDGRQQRLFNRGHLEEARFISWLEGIGCEVKSHESDGKQMRISDCHGHFGGSLDAKILLPPSYKMPLPILGEFKTNGTGAPFNKVKNEGVFFAKPMHFAQMSTYGFKEELTHGLYANINKNDDSIHFEIVKLDWTLGARMIEKAGLIIENQIAPPKLSENPTYLPCSWCDFKEICHGKKQAQKNCRSCKHAAPAIDAQWYCNKNQDHIPLDFVPKGCGEWQSILEA